MQKLNRQKEFLNEYKQSILISIPLYIIATLIIILIFGTCNGNSKEAEELFYKVIKLYSKYVTPMYFTFFPLFVAIHDYRITVKTRLKKLKLHLKDRKTIGLLNPLYPKKFSYTYVYKDIPFTVELRYKDKYVDLNYFSWEDRKNYFPWEDRKTSYAYFSYHIKSIIHFNDSDITVCDYDNVTTLGSYRDCKTLDEMAFKITQGAVKDTKEKIVDFLLDIQDSPKLINKKVFVDKV